MVGKDQDLQLWKNHFADCMTAWRTDFQSVHWDLVVPVSWETIEKQCGF